MRYRTLAAAAAILAAATALAGSGAEPYATDAEWGEALFLDPNLSLTRSQSCATCHDPAAGFADPRDDGAGGAVSVGADGHSVGIRNAPTAAYAAFAPGFGTSPRGIWRGGQFLDGRAADLAAQAEEPLLNPAEMAMPDPAAVVARLVEDPRHAATLRARLGTRAGDTSAAFAAATAAIAAFERTETFHPFDSRYDRALRGEIDLTEEEELGRLLFFSKQFTNCNRCHQLRNGQTAADETFSNYEYHNIGVPANPALAGPADPGLAARPGIDDPAATGRFKVPTLRNVAVTGPYMHNGVFRDLETVIRFYNHYNSRAPAAAINPETGAPWAPPEVAGTLSLDDLNSGPALDDRRIRALVAFLRTLTDARYEPLLER